MRWTLDNPKAGEVIEAYAKFNQPIPKELTPPELHDIEWLYWEAFWDLNTERRAAGLQIPASAIRIYAENEQGTDARTFSLIIRAMDSVYLSHKPPKSKP